MHLKVDFKSFPNHSYFLKIDLILAEILALVGDSILLAKVVRTVMVRVEIKKIMIVMPF